jgi:outer membrane immunogenic protein
MRRLLLGIIALIALAMAPAMAADLRMPVKAPPPVAPPVANWTGCFLGIGYGYGISSTDHDTSLAAGGGLIATTQTTGGKGYLGTAAVGCDVQVQSAWVVGAFLDGDLASIKGNQSWACGATCPFGDFGFGGEMKERSAWAVGGRLGYAVTPQLLTYFDGGFTQARFGDVSYSVNASGNDGIGAATGLLLPSQTYSGWFLGGGTEYALGFLPGLYWKNEYRYASYQSKTIADSCVGITVSGCTALGASGVIERVRPVVQTVRSSLVWRTNWGALGGPSY